MLPLDAEPRGPLTRAWLQLFEDEGLGSSLPHFFETDRWLVLDWEDWGKDDFDHFGFFNFNDQADSMRWFAPAGCAIRLNQPSLTEGGAHPQSAVIRRVMGRPAVIAAVAVGPVDGIPQSVDGDAPIRGGDQ